MGTSKPQVGGPQSAFTASFSDGMLNMSSKLKGRHVLPVVGAVVADVEVKTSADTSSCENNITATGTTKIYITCTGIAVNVIDVKSTT